MDIIQAIRRCSAIFCKETFADLHGTSLRRVLTLYSDVNRSWMIRARKLWPDPSSFQGWQLWIEIQPNDIEIAIS